MPRFQTPHLERNRRLSIDFEKLADDAGCSMAQLALAWLLARGDHVLPIPGTTSVAHLEENAAAMNLQIDPDLLAHAGALINEQTLSGSRYPEGTQREIGTEEFADVALQR